METSGNALLEAVERTATLEPGAPAFRTGDGRVTTYGELWTLALDLAAGIHGRVAGNDPVIVLGKKDARTVAAMLACLASGHAYAPVDADLPVARVRDIAGQMPYPTLLSTCPVPRSLHAAIPACTMLDAGSLTEGVIGVAPGREAWVSGDETQYVIFTSGSTGRPKGIEVTANNVAAFMRWLVTFPVVKPRVWKPPWTWWKACALTAATSPPTL